MTKIKYCGITEIEEINVINSLGIDYVGFVFAKKSKRYISPEKAAILKKSLDSGIKTVGVFTDEDVSVVAKLYKAGVIDLAQLHAHEDNDYIKRLRNLCDVKIIKAFGVITGEDVKAANESAADMVLLDSKGGGTGKVFDWEILKGINREYFLAGGLNETNIKKAKDLLNPYGLDVSSGIETNGKKDEDKMIKLISIIREEK